MIDHVTRFSATSVVKPKKKVIDAFIQHWIAMFEALVLGRAGKRSGKNKTWFNLKDLTNNIHLIVDFSQIKGWKNTEEEVLIADSHDNIEILQTKETELKN